MEQRLIELAKKFELAKAADPGFELFGASHHRYQLEPPLGEAEILAFEKKYKIGLPPTYRNFLLKVGSKGAGPYYGLISLDTNVDGNLIHKPCEIWPGMTDDEIDALEARGDEEDELLERSGLLELGTQGCSTEICLVLEGPHRDRIVYLDWPNFFFVYEKNFLDWYERWLDDIIAGYDTSFYGHLMGGEPHELVERFRICEEEETAVNILRAMTRFPKVPEPILDFLASVAKNTATPAGQQAIKLLIRFDYQQAHIFLGDMFESGDEQQIREAASSIYAKKETCVQWAPTALEAITRVTHRKSYCALLDVLNRSEIDASEVLSQIVATAEEDIRGLIFFYLARFENKTPYATLMETGLNDPSPKVVSKTVRALCQWTEKDRYLNHFEEIAERFLTNEEGVLENLMYNLSAMRPQALPLLEKLTTHPHEPIAIKAQNILEHHRKAQTPEIPETAPPNAPQSTTWHRFKRFFKGDA